MMRFARLAPLLLLAALAFLPARAQDPALRDALQTGKGLWATQGDRDGAASKFEAILAALEPRARTLDEGWTKVLCETYNWMAILDSRPPGKPAQAAKRLESLLDLDPDFEIDRAVSSARLQTTFDTLRSQKFGKVKLTLEPADGVLTLDGKAMRTDSGSHYLAPGPHVLTFTRPGFQPMDHRFDLAAKDTLPVDLKLTRTSSVITIYTSPVGAEVILDGKPLGVTRGQVPAAKSLLAETARLKPEQLSEGFLLTSLAAGKHKLDVRMPCYKPILLEIGEAFTTPFADHELDPIKLEPSRASLTVQSAAPGGQLILNGLVMGPVPVTDLQVCAQAYDLQIKYPTGSFTQHIELQEGRALAIAARPKPRLTYVGFEGNDDFAGRERILAMLGNLGERVRNVAFLTPPKGEAPKDAIARLKGSKETELLLWARPVPGKPIHQIELVLSTLTGEEERILVKPLENDPLGALAARMDRQPALMEPWAGLTLLDLPAGVYVLQADAAAQRAGIRPGRSLVEAAGKPLATVAEFRKALAEAKGSLTVSQGETPVKLAVTPMAVELPVNAQEFCYPMVLADLRLRQLGAQGDEEALLRLHQALALMHFREYEKAQDVLRDARMGTIQGVSQGTLDYYTGVCLLRMGNVYLTEALQSFNLALKYPLATLFGPEGPLLAPLARQALQDLQP